MQKQVAKQPTMGAGLVLLIFFKVMYCTMERPSQLQQQMRRQGPICEVHSQKPVFQPPFLTLLSDISLY